MRFRFASFTPLVVVVGLGCGGSLVAPTEPESTTLHVGHRVGGGRVAEASAEEIALSVGMRADIELFEPHTLEGGAFSYAPDRITRAEVRSATPTDETTARVVALHGSHATLEGLAPGSTRITFATTRGTRTFAVHVAEPASVRVRHWGWERLAEGAPVAFVRGGIARFEMTRRDMAHRVLGGYGGALPVRVDPPRAARLSIRDGDVGHVDVHLEQVAERAALRPLGGPVVELAIVEPEVTDVLSLAMVDADAGESALPDALLVGTKKLLTIVATRADGTRLFGLIERAGLVSTTPEVCGVESMDTIYADGIYELDATAEGTCELEVQPREGTPVRARIAIAPPR